MTKLGNKIFISVMALIVIIVFVSLCYIGIPYYKTSIEERFFDTSHNLLKPSGVLGHGFGIFGSFFMILGMLSYMARKRFRSLSRLGNLKYWLEFHIFLCTLGPILILFHTSFKFGGIVAISFWSMVAVFLSGIIGRFIYIQIPRTIEGRELSLNEVRNLKNDIGEILRNSYKLDEGSYNTILTSISSRTKAIQGNFFIRNIRKYVDDVSTIKLIRQVLKKNNLPKHEIKKIIELTKNDISLNRKIERLVTMQKLFNYWHVAHLPFALVMLIIMVIHVTVTIAFGYKWIF
ncbi:MAG TPA: hypothetical protein DIW31_05355 [Bacteroidales bacterium]|nr:hypothetical protein [Bacteroidales bacterium]